MRLGLILIAACWVLALVALVVFHFVTKKRKVTVKTYVWGMVVIFVVPCIMSVTCDIIIRFVG